MKLYSATVQVNADPDNQVQKHNLTAAEMKLLEFIHAGKKPVLLNIELTGTTNRKDRKERARLAQEYSRGDLHGDALVQKLFGVDGVPLPQSYESPIIQSVEVFDDEDEEEEVIESVPRAGAPMTAEQLIG